MPITFLDEEEEIVPVAPKKTGKRRITFLDEEESLEEDGVKPESEVITPASGRKITFLDEEPEDETPAPVGTSFIEELAAIPQAIKQSIDQPLEAMGETAEVLGASGIGGALRGAVEGPEDYVPAAQRFMEPQEGEFQVAGFAPQFLPRAIVEQAGQIGGAILTRAGGMAIGGLAGSALGPKGTAAGAVAGAFIGPALFEMGQIVGPVARERAANQGREEPTTDDLAWAWSTAGASGALNAIGAKYIPGGDKLTGSLAKKISTAIAGEGSTEGLQSVVQQTGQTFLTEQGFEIKPKEVVGETILGGGAAGTTVAATAPFTKAAAAAETKVVAEQVAPIAPETAQAVSEQANRVMQEAQAEETAETPEQRVARLQREAQEGVGEIELEEEPPVSGLPPIETYEQVQAKQRDAQEKFRQYAEEQRARGATEEQINEARQKQLKPALDKIESDWRSATETAATEWSDSIDPFNLPQLPENLRLAEARIFGEKLLQRLAKDLGVTEDNTVTLNATTPDGRSGTVRISMSGDGEVRAVSQFGEGASRSEGFGFLDFVTEGFNAQTGETTLSRVEPIKLQQPVTPPVTPTPEAAVAPVEPAVAAEGAVEPAAVAAPTEPVAPTEPTAAEPAPVVTPRPAVDVEALSPNAKRANRILTNAGVDPETAAFVAQQYQDEIADLGGEELRAFVLDKFEENGGVIPAQMRYSEDQEYYEMAFGIGPEEAATLVENAKAQNAQMAQAELEQNKQWRRKDGQQITEAQQGVAVAQPEAQAVPVPAGEVPPSPAIEGRRVPLAAPEAAVTPAIPQLEPLRRVARAEQTEEDVAGLVGQGLVELYNGQPVITQAGLEALPEAERPRLTPEARKIQIDTRTSEAAAEAISKNLRIGVDQVPPDVRMPAGWTLVGDIYIPPVVEAAPAPQPEARESRVARDPEVQKAAQDLKAGTIDREEYQRIVDMRMPLRKFEAVPTPANNEDMLRGLGERKAGDRLKKDLIQNPEAIAEGTVLEARLDIPAYESENVWVVSLHKQRTDLQKGTAAEVIAYTPTSVLRNVTFGVTEKAAAGIAAGKPKSTIATMRGEYVPMTAEQAYELANTNKDQWVEIGMNPVRHSYFYDKDTQTPVESAEEVVQVGGMVLAKNPVFGKREDYLYSLREAQPTVGMTTDAVRARLEALGFGVEGMIRIVEDPQAAFEGRTIIQDGKAVRIELNASALNDNAAIDRVLNHEFAEAANADGALNKLVERLTPKEKKEINDAITRLGYEERVRTTEEAARAIETLAAGWKGRGFFERAVARVEAWGSKLGLKLTRRAAEYIAARNLAEVSETVRKWNISEALANLNGARRVTFGGIQAVLVPPSEMQVAYSIAAHHGTPHEIKGGFQTAKIGTGEGATAYGWGLYFAENVEVAKEYQRNLSKGQYALSYEGVPVNELPTDQKNAILKIAAGIPVETVIADLETSLRRQEASKPEDWAVPANRERVIEELKSSIEEARKIKPSEIKPRTAGNLYRVELDLNEDELLDWDAPLSGQSEKVKASLQPLFDEFDSKAGRGIYKEDRLLGVTIYNQLVDTRDEAYGGIGKEQASKRLLSLGIKGIKYLDAGSRAEGGTYNYVVFDENLIKITEVNGKPVEIRESRREPAPRFTEDTPEAKTLSNLKASMEKVDSASEAKGGKPTTQKVSEIAANWMEQGGDERALQDAIIENTNLSPVNAAKVAKVIAKQYGLQQQIAETGAVIAEIAPEAEGAPRKSSVTKLIEQTTGVRKPVVKLQVSESAALKKQIQLKAREARETRKARKEAAEDLAKSITDYVKANPIRGPINSRQAMSITKRALKLDVNNEAAVDRFEMYVERVIENANYDQDLADARALIKRAKTFAKSKDTQGNVKTTLDAIASISPTLLDNPFEFNLVVQRYLLGLAPVTSKQYAVMPDADVRRYLESLETQISANQDVLDRSKAQRILDKQAAYANEKGIPLDEAIAILNSEEFLNEKTIEKLEDLTKLLTSMAQESQKDVRAYDETGATPKQKELISFMGKVNLDSLTNEEKKRYIRFSNNLLANGATFGMEQFQSIALGQESAIKALKDKRLSNKLAAWISPIGGDKAIDTARRIALKTQSEADTFKNIFGREAVGAFRKILGLNRLDVAQTDSNRAKEQIANEFGEYFKGLRKKYGNDATGFEAKGYAGIAGYLIQTDGIKTEAESIPYRRRLMEQNIVELRKSDKQADLAEADLKERALTQLTGTSNAEILSQLKALNPASYEQLMWVKDTMLPKWRDFLKEHDENFRNQANNYNNPDHLTITYKFPEGQLLPNEIEDVYQQDAIGMRIKQAANSIKRKEHSNLPVSPRTGTVANIDINFGYNQYNALVDQVDKAFVAPAWEQVVAFTKAPEFEQVMGGRANATFVKKLLTDIQTSRTRQSMTDDEAQMVAGGVRLARKISTQAVLGGFTQPLRQIPDQLSKLFFTTGRVDLIKKNLLKTAEAAPLLNKFPIGRRGDAQAGTQYASQFSELARKVEASVTDRKWAQYRELMNRVGEFWMAPLRGSDVWAAKVSWMSYYEAELNKKGIKMESWEREAELVETDDARKEAASYAEFAVDFYGGASDPTKMASLSKQTNNGWKEFAKLLFLPLNSFALQQKNSLISDLRDAYLRTGDRKASIAAIAGTLAGMAAFHGMRIYIIGGLLYPAGKALLMGIFGIDMDEPDEEEKQKKLEDDWRKFKASMYGNIVAGGAGQFVEQSAIDAVNKATYMIQANVNPDELLNDKGEIMSFRQYEKDLSPLYRFRSFGKSEYTFGLADVLTEQAQFSLAETQQIMSPEEMERYTGNEQAYAMFSTMVEWLYFFRLMDTDVTRIARDLKRQMDKGVEEREKDIKAIRNR